jgi:hypothetical protein
MGIAASIGTTISGVGAQFIAPVVCFEIGRDKSRPYANAM